MKTAILGFPQSGKRTLFSLLTGRKVGEGGRKEGESIEAVAPVRDPRVDRLAEITRPQKKTYAGIQVVLCPDITEGPGKRDWLEAARRCDLLCVLVRSFTAQDVYHPKGSVDAKRDHGDLEAEILLADLDLIEKRLERLGKEKRGGLTPVQVLEEKTLAKCGKAIGEGRFLSSLDLQPQELQSINSLGLLTLVPVLWAYNVDEDKVGAAGQEGGRKAFIVSCRIEQEIMSIQDSGERQEYLKEIGLDSPGLDRMVSAVYDTLGLMSFYTIGSDEVRAWTIRKNTPAPVAGGKVHTDIERGFIRVEVIKYDDLVAAGNEATVRAQGKFAVKGKDYVIEDGDICMFRFNV